MRVAVGSRNPVKLAAVERALSRVFGDVEVVAVPVKTSVGEQPIGLRSVIRGAVERASQAVRCREVELGVGVEAGLIKAPATITGYLDVQACAIVDSEGLVSIGMGPGFEFPPEAVNAVLSGESRELEEPMVRLSGIEGIGDKMGAIGWLTKGLISRVDITEVAVIMALVPRLNRDLYRLRRVEDVLAEL